MKLQKMHWMGMVGGALVVLIAIILLTVSDTSTNLTIFILGLGLALGVLPFIVALAMENKREQEVSEMFLEFSRNLAESVTTGTPISKSIINMSRKNYGALSPHIVKLANQISLGIPVSKALLIFSHDVDNPVISRAVGLISEAERAGGEIDYILDSVSKSIAEVEKLKKERKAAISTLVVQGYIIFFIFIVIMMVMEYKILPVANSATGFGNGTSLLGSEESNKLTPKQISGLFLGLLLVQGFFTGLVIGKLAEGSLYAGIKHSFIMMISAFLASTGLTLFVGPPGVAT